MCLLEVLTLCLIMLIVMLCYGVHLIMSTSSVDGTYYILRGAHTLLVVFNHGVQRCSCGLPYGI